VNLGASARAESDVLVGTSCVYGEGTSPVEAAMSVRRRKPAAAGPRTIRLDPVTKPHRAVLEPEKDPDQIGLPDLDTVGRALRRFDRRGSPILGDHRFRGDRSATSAVAMGNSNRFRLLTTCLILRGMTVGPGFPFQDYGQIIDAAAQRGIGVTECVNRNEHGL